MRLLPITFLAIVGFLGLAAMTNPSSAQAEGLDCLISRGNQCFNTGCTNRSKSLRMSLDLAQGQLRLCPNRFNDEGCTDIPIAFDIRDNALTGATLQGPEFAARSLFLNRVTGALTVATVMAGGVAAVDYGTCEVPR